MRLSDYQPNPNPESLAILQGIAKSDKSAARDCIDAYGSLIWALARKHTDSLREGENAAPVIFLDI